MYIVVEGLDFTGKSTLSKALAEHYHAHRVTEPFRDSPDTQLISSLIESPKLGNLYKTQLYIASRLELFLTLKEENHPFVISDRNFLSNMVYQGNDMETMERILTLNHEAAKAYSINLVPDIVIYMDVPYEVVFERYRSRATVSDYDRFIINKARYESFRRRYRVALNLMQSFYSHQTRILTIDHNSSIENVKHQINLLMNN